MTVVGVALLGFAFVAAGGFVAAVVRADARVHAVDPASTSGLTGWPLAWLAASVLSVAAGVLVLGGAVLL